MCMSGACHLCECLVYVECVCVICSQVHVMCMSGACHLCECLVYVKCVCVICSQVHVRCMSGACQVHVNSSHKACSEFNFIE